MLNIKFEVVQTFVEDDFKCAFKDVLSKIKHVDGLLKMSVFVECLSDNDYQSKIDWINYSIHEKFGKELPAVSLVAQKPLMGSVFIELIYLVEDAELSYKNHLDYTYALVKQNDRKSIYLSGMKADPSENINSQGNTIFSVLDEILKKEGMKPESIIRQWNYIPKIIDFDDDFQHYQQFNDSRSLFYQKSRWANGYPAATGIGTQCGPLVIDVIAMQGHDDEFAIKNPRQIDAHVYSEQVLLGEDDLCLKQKSTPKFERAKLIVDQDTSVVFVSGTAAIIGEESLSINDAAKQTILTFENIERLVDHENLDGYKMFEASKIDAMRVYIKNEEDFKMIQNICEERYPSISFIYLLSDVCRDELLVEIEAFVYCM